MNTHDGGSTSATLDRLPSQRSKRARDWTSAALGVVIFIAGGICGAATMRVSPAPKLLTSLSEVPNRVAYVMQRDLSLTEQQREQVEAIVREHQPELHRIRMQTFPQMRGELERVIDELAGVLTPDQAKRFRAEAERRLEVRFPSSESVPTDTRDANQIQPE